ncbi:MAG: 3-dehydroquinate synthase [Rhodobacteraceae bacterium]|nr:3-dehydroquinate synthase [Paracoccaceae bacterium]
MLEQGAYGRLDDDAEAVLWQEFSVPFRFPVAFTRNALAPDNSLLADMLSMREADKRHRLHVVVDEGVAAAWPNLNEQIAAYVATYGNHLELLDAPRVVPGGERIKQSFEHVEAVLDDTHRLRIDRHSYIVAIGGGAMLDAIGLAAATAHRGVRHVRLPTTVLSQNDSGVGVKNAVNLKNVKNFMGSFAPPWAVLNDFNFLDTLEPRDKVSGVSEAVKVALIRDPAFFYRLEQDADALAAFQPAETEYMIRRCAELHMRQIGAAGDPFEMGSARPLDFGHWAAHKLEAMTEHAVRHGEAVAIGIALDSRYSVLSGRLAPGLDERICALMERLGFGLWHDALDKVGASGEPALLTGLREFQEHLGGQLTVTLLSEIGTGVEVHEIDGALMMQAVDWLQTRATS